MHGGMKFPVEANVMEKSDKNLPVEKHSSSIVHWCLTTASTHTVNNHSDVFKNKSSYVLLYTIRSLFVTITGQKWRQGHLLICVSAICSSIIIKFIVTYTCNYIHTKVVFDFSTKIFLQMS